MQIAVIDLGMGNLRSVEQALHAVCADADVVVTDQASIIAQADKVVLPGQGATGSWFKALQDRQLKGCLLQAIEEKPLLGICVGMQAMFSYCEEGDTQALNLFDGQVRHFRHFHETTDGLRLKIPQMGWNQVKHTQEHALWHAIDDNAYFYFVHSYCANLEVGLSMSDDASPVVGQADYGHEFIAAVAKDNVFAVQFHPEKSHKDGLQLLANFTQWNGQV